MKPNFQQLVAALNTSPLSVDVLHQLTLLLEQQNDKPFHSLLVLEQWAWQLLSQQPLQWINQPYYQQFFYTLASFNKKLIFNYDDIEADAKATVLFPVTVDQINNIFKQIEQSHDDNDPFISIIALWFDNHSYFIHDNPHSSVLLITDHINQYIIHNYITSEQNKIYLTQLSQLQLAQPVFTAKMLFSIKTCSFSIFSYIGVRVYSFPYTADEILRYIGSNYVHIVHIHSRTVALWSKELLACMTQLISFTSGLCWWDGDQRTQTKILFPTEQMTCDHVQDLIRIIAHKPFHKQIKSVRSNDETSLIDATLLLLLTVVQTQNINWFFRSSVTIQNTLLTLANISLFDDICLCAYGILGEVLTDEQLKAMKITNTMSSFFFDILAQAWHHPSKKYKQIPIEYLLRGFLNLSKHDFIQQKAAISNKMPLLIELCDIYPIVYDIIWALSFNQDIQQQLRSSSSFMSKLANLNKTNDDEQMRKTTHGIFWNLEINHQDHPISQINNEETFDVMISYSHKDKILCEQLYEELTKGGYRVWIDFDQMHGNVIHSMAQAIERSKTVIICMSEQYRRSNYCRTEAQYAFQRQRKIVPVLMQKHYKADGWLLFLIGQLLYIDFTKHQFERAITMLLKELKVTDTTEINEPLVLPIKSTDIISTIPSSTPQDLPIQSNPSDNILEWTEIRVHDWLIEHKLLQMSRLLANCDGCSLVYLCRHMKRSESQQWMKSLHEDSIRRTGETLSLIELSCLQSLIDQERKIARSKLKNRNKISR